MSSELYLGLLNMGQGYSYPVFSDEWHQNLLSRRKKQNCKIADETQCTELIQYRSKFGARMAIECKSSPSGFEEALARILTFAAHPSSTVLDLSGLSLTSLPEHFIDSISDSAVRITRINLAGNSLTTLPLWLSKLPNLRILFLLGNKFTALPPVLSSLQALHMLSFKHCKLTGELHASQLPPNLIWLILTDNRISSLSTDFGSRCRNVRKLLLANNRLTSLPNSFSKLSSLELLRLANNPLPIIPPVLATMPSLTWVALGGTPACGGTVATVDDLPAELRLSLADYAPIPGAKSLGGGASGNVMRCSSPSGGPDIALKRFANLLTSDGSALDEVALVLAARDVAHAVRAVGFAYEEDALWLATELVPGTTALAAPPSFDSVTRDAYPPRPISAPVACAALLAATGATAGLHSCGIVHGDVYAHNTISDAEGRQARLCDFGAAFRPPPDALLNFCRIEVRALGVLCEELAQWVPEVHAPLVKRTARRCMAHRLERPSAREVFDALEPLKEVLPSSDITES